MQNPLREGSLGRLDSLGSFWEALALVAATIERQWGQSRVERRGCASLQDFDAQMAFLVRTGGEHGAIG